VRKPGHLTTYFTQTLEDNVAATLEKLQEYMQQKLPGDQVDFLKSLAGLLFEKATAEFLEEFDLEALQAIALGSLRQIEQLKDGKPHVRIFNPSHEADGWTSRYSVIEISLTDRPFIVDSVRAEIRRRGQGLHFLLHPIMPLHRSDNGKLIRSLDKEGAHLQAYELYFVDHIKEDDVPTLQTRLHEILNDVVLATDDYGAFKNQADEIKAYLAGLRVESQDDTQKADLSECEAFVDWLKDDNFLFAGYREYKLLDQDGQRYLQIDLDSCLGILRNVASSNYLNPVPLQDISDNLRARITDGPLLIVTKANSEATIHRAVRMDYIGVKRWNSEHAVVGEMRLLGLFTAQAMSTPVKEIPILRRKLQRVLEQDQSLEGSHDYKQIESIFNTMPREELFWSEPENILRDIRAIMGIQRQHKVRVILRPDPLSRGVQAMVIMPKDRFNSQVRNDIQDLLSKRFEAQHVDYQLSIGEDEEQVRFHFFFTTNSHLHHLDLGALESEIADMTRTWSDRLREKLNSELGDANGYQIHERYRDAFHESYKSTTSLSVAARDVVNLEKLHENDTSFLVDLINAPEDNLNEPTSQLRIYHPSESLHLSDVLPILENLGLRVLMQDNSVVKAQTRPKSCIDVFRVVDKREGKQLDIRRHRATLATALVDLLQGQADNDRLNGLMLTTTMSLRHISLLRSFQIHYHQVQPASTRAFLNDVLLENPKSAELLFKYFEARFKPDFADRDKVAEAFRLEFMESLNSVTSLAYDRTLRGLCNLVESVLRTNYYLEKPYISHKVNSHNVKNMPEPRPLYEIIVAAPGVDGIHLRGGKVARGGLRWSDRPDFRTEVLGLMKTQMTKNACIVPVGSKGGFALKKAPREREALQKYVVEQYKVFISGLLDLTDNLVGGRVVPPANVVRYDEDDPYLVVAADKGTATFSDIANGVSAEYGFWLGDAFASGGSAGYDHKKEGITARGAWEGVKRHFREMGIDCTKQDITVAGIGDLAGDVFGNGLIYCDTLRLLAAFNHLHIFLDPNPPTKDSYAERVRMFNLPRSSWEDYDKSLISEGGGIFLRAAKSIPLSPQVKAILDVQEDALSGEDLVKAILKMPVDLLWNGGIGTYVKSSDQRNVDVGDSSNDSVRIDAPELRAKVVGEGGNQGFTQLGRIEYAKNGGRINTDAIDNSAGVDMSDHEVNIKILLGPMVSQGELSMVQRNELLGEMTQEVNQLVLNDNYFQTLSLSISEGRSREALPLFVSLMNYMADRGGLKKDVESLPDSRTLQERARAGEGLYRPELAILLAYTKMGLYRRILETDFTDEASFQHFLLDYFPTALKERYPDKINKHPLRREIIATQFTNIVVDLLGMTFVHRKIQDTGATPIQVIRAGLAALEIVEARQIVDKLTTLDNQVPSEAIYHALGRLTAAIEAVADWMLLTDVDLSSLSDFIKNYREPLSQLRKQLRAVLPPAQLARFERIDKQATSAGFPESIAAEVSSLEWVPTGLGVVDTSRGANLSLQESARRFYELGERFQLSWIREQLRNLPTNDKWEQIAVVGFVTQLRTVQLDLVLSGREFPSVDGGLVARFEQALQEVQDGGKLSLATGAVLVRMLDQMAKGAHSHDPKTREKQPVLPGVTVSHR
jgi:glutamate dehydrogenase